MRGSGHLVGELGQKLTCQQLLLLERALKVARGLRLEGASMKTQELCFYIFTALSTVHIMRCASTND
ncbi:hypothetical protein PF011_g33149 [Phytophthora fragariae]|uniref:Uncharacterized protein n=1 Tax=Phytophthora fragariae TaxID=53985 RepID=A0A6A3FX76_9STRA|nr:hypothetical protein PF011_g33149 [Phytophthora fragariae]